MAMMELPSRMEVRNLDQHSPIIPADHTGKSSRPPPAPRCGVWGVLSKTQGCDVPGGPRGTCLPWAGSCGHSPLTVPGAAGKLVKHPQGAGASRGSWVHRSQVDFAGDDPESACWLCFPDDLGMARAASGLTDHDSRGRGSLRGAEIPTSATEGACGPLRNDHKAGVWVGRRG